MISQLLLYKGLFILIITAAVLASPDIETDAFCTVKENLVDVSTFGAKANDGKNDLPAIREALSKCVKENSTLYFPKGSYDLFVNAENSKGIFIINGSRKFTMEGNGSELLFHYNHQYLSRSKPDPVFVIKKAIGLTMRNFSIDYARPSFSVGTVVKIESNYFDVKIQPGFPVKGGELVGAYMDYNPQTKVPVGLIDIYNSVTKTELIAPQLLRLHEKNKVDENLKVGNLLVMRHHIYGGNGFYIENSSDILMQNITVHTVPGMAFIARNDKNITLEQFNIIPGKERIMSATADGFNLGNCSGTVKISNCFVEGLGDDGINLHVDRYFRVVKKIDDKTVLVDIKGYKAKDIPSIGDSVEFYHPTDMICYKKMKVAYSSSKPPYDTTYLIRFTEPLPQDIIVSDAIAKTSTLSGALISNSTFRNIRARGIIIKERNVIIENCRVENTTMLGIWVGAEHHQFFESYGCRNIIVRNNTIRDCGLYTQKKPGKRSVPGAICAYIRLAGDTMVSLPGSLHNISFVNNTVQGARNSGIFIAGVNGINITGNRVEMTCQAADNTNGKAAIYLQGSNNIKMGNNRIPAEKQGAQFYEKIKIGVGCDSSYSQSIEIK